MAEKILEVENLRVSYEEDQGKLWKKRGEREVLKGVSFSMEEGEILGLVGESGSGKSTLARTVLGLVAVKSGTIRHASDHPQMVFQDPFSSLNPVKKVGWLLEEPLRLKGGFTRAERRKKAAEMLKRVGLEEKMLERYPRQLSGGQRQRVSLACALMLEPRLLVADECVSALDVTVQAQIVELMLQLRKEMGLSILFISHDMRIVYQICDRVIILEEGRIVEEGEVERVYFEPVHPYTKALLAAAGIREE